MDNHKKTPAWIVGTDLENRYQYLSNSGFVISKKSDILKLSTDYESWIDVLQKDKPKLLWFILPDHSGVSVEEGMTNALKLSLYHSKTKGRAVFEWQERSRAWKNPMLQKLVTKYSIWNQAYVSWTIVHTDLDKHGHNATNFLSTCRREGIGN
eukprot:4499615-Karenia_brevis.AAC.1